MSLAVRIVKIQSYTGNLGNLAKAQFVPISRFLFLGILHTALFNMHYECLSRSFLFECATCKVLANLRHVADKRRTSSVRCIFSLEQGTVCCLTANRLFCLRSATWLQLTANYNTTRLASALQRCSQHARGSESV